jgi:hypothetical protein
MAQRQISFIIALTTADMVILKGMRFQDQDPKTGGPVQNGDNIIILLKECHIGDIEHVEKRHESLWEKLEHDFDRTFNHKDKDKVEINLSFQFGTGLNPPFNSIPVGPFMFTDIENGNGKSNSSDLLKDHKMGPVVILPRTQVQDYFSLTVNVTYTSMIMANMDTISKIIQDAGNIGTAISGPSTPSGSSTSVFPSPLQLPATIVSTSANILGNIMNIVALLNSDKTVIHARQDYVVTTDGKLGNLNYGELKVQQEDQEGESPSFVLFDIRKLSDIQGQGNKKPS